MAIIRWDPGREMDTLQSEMNRLFNTFFDAPSVRGQGNGGQRRWIPAMDLVEEGDHYLLRADLPGLTQDDVSIELEDSVLTISGERRNEHSERREGVVRVERVYGSFSRQLTLPEGVDPAAIEARFDNGVLEVRVPKPEERKPHKVSIQVGGGEAKTIEGTASDN